MIPHICVYTDSNILADMVVPRTVKQSSCIFGETNAGSFFKSPPYHYVPGWLESRFRQIIYTSHAKIAETTVKQCQLVFILSPSTTALFTSALFLAW